MWVRRRDWDGLRVAIQELTVALEMDLEARATRRSHSSNGISFDRAIAMQELRVNAIVSGLEDLEDALRESDTRAVAAMGAGVVNHEQLERLVAILGEKLDIDINLERVDPNGPDAPLEQ